MSKRKQARSGGGARPSRSAQDDAVPGITRASGTAVIRWMFFAVIVLVSAVIVATAFNPAPHTGGDNAGYVTLAYSLLHNHSYTELFDPAHPAHTKYPPVFPALLALFMLMGARSWVSLKAVAVLSTIATVAVTYLWAERRTNPVWALGTSLALALASAVVYYSHWVLSDPTFLAFTVVSLFALERADGGRTMRALAAARRRKRRNKELAREGIPPDVDLPGPRSAWLVLGVTAAGLAYFTRSAGLPLLVAVFAWLALRKRWRALVGSAVGLGVPALLWFIRGRMVGSASYGREFWMVNPYDPSLGNVGIGGLVGRMAANVGGYLGTHLPGGIVGAGGPGVVALGVGVVILGLGGWAVAVRHRIGPTELFLPLYAGLILLWPEVWSGDRFALPLFPVLFLYGASLLHDSRVRFGKMAPSVAGVVVFALMVIPEAGTWTRARTDAAACAARVRQQGAFACYGAGVEDFADAAAWSGANLPEGSAVLSRKPRLFYVLSGVPSRVFPFDEHVDAHLDLAGEVGARYELVDRWDALSGRYVVAAVRERPQAYCAVRGFGQGTQLLGIVPPDEQSAAPPDDEQGIVISTCPASYVAGDGSAPYSSSSLKIPLLAGLDP